MKLAVLILLFTLTGFAQERITVDHTPRNLSLAEAVELALQNNADIALEKTNVRSSQLAAHGARGAFDPLMCAQTFLRTGATPVSSVLDAPGGRLNERSAGQTLSLSQRLQNWGTRYDATLESQRTSNNNPFLGLNPYFSSRLTFGVTQPLARNRATDAERTELAIRRKNTALAQTDFELRVIEIVTRVEQAYWDLAAALETQQINLAAVKLAEEFKASTARQVQAGETARAELAAAEAELQRRRDTQLAQLNEITQAENALKQLLSNSSDESLWQLQLLPTTSSSEKDQSATRELLAQGLTAVIERARRERVELRGVAQRLDVNGLERALAANQLRPQIDLNVSYSSQGLTGRFAPVPDIFGGGTVALPNQFRGGLGKSIGQTFGGRYQTWQASLTIELPLGNRAAEARYGETQLAEQRLQLSRVQFEQAITAQVRNAVESVHLAQERLAAAAIGTRAAEERLSSETRLFTNGESTGLLVLTRQNELTDSRRREALARLDKARSFAQLAQAVGLTLTNRQIKLAASH